MKNVYIVCALSGTFFCCAMNRDNSEQRDLTAVCILKFEDKLCQRFKDIITLKDVKDLKKKKDAEETQGTDLPRGGKYVMTSNGIVKLPLPDNRRFGRG